MLDSKKPIAISGTMLCPYTGDIADSYIRYYFQHTVEDVRVCDWCGSSIENNIVHCPKCGGPNRLERKNYE